MPRGYYDYVKRMHTPAKDLELAEKIGDFRLIFNTAPGMMVPAHIAASCQSCLKVDLASVPGIGGADVIQARGLPGLHVPESAGKLIARTVLRLTQEGRT